MKKLVVTKIFTVKMHKKRFMVNLNYNQLIKLIGHKVFFSKFL